MLGPARITVRVCIRTNLKYPQAHHLIQPLPSLLKQHASDATAAIPGKGISLSCLFQAGRSAAGLWKRTATGWLGCSRRTGA
jgi:hypothetical protein